MFRKASPETIAAIRKLRARTTVRELYPMLGTTPSTYAKVVDGMPVQDEALRRIEANLARLEGRTIEPMATSTVAVGTRHGKLIVVSEAPRTGKDHGLAVNIRCDCGIERSMRVDSIRRGAKSCGCGREPAITSPHVKVEHGRVLYEAFGRWQTAEAWAKETGVPLGTFRARVMTWGRSPEESLTMSRVKRGTFVLGRKAS